MIQRLQSVSVPLALGLVAALVVIAYAASQVFHWSAGWQVLILSLADVAAFAMFFVLILDR